MSLFDEERFFTPTLENGWYQRLRFKLTGRCRECEGGN